LDEDAATDKPVIEEFPSNPTGGRQWIYVQDVPPENLIQSNISTDNIVEGRRVCQQVCYVSTSANPKSHAMAMKCAKSLAWMEAEKKEVDNMMWHSVCIKRPHQPDDAPIASTWAYR
jgi:hypothetical protein